jgi:MFS family permease
MNLTPLLLAIFFVLIPVSAARPMTSLFAKQLDASMVEIGLITACYSITPLVLAVFAGRYIDRYGEKIPIFIGSLGIIISLCLPFFFPMIPILYISQLLLGGGHLLALLAVQNGVTKSASNQNRDQAVGSFSLFTSIGMLLGPLIGGYTTEHLGFQMSYILISLIPIASIIVSQFTISSPRNISRSTKKNSTNYNYKELLLIPGLSRSIFVSMIILSALDIFYVYFPLYAQSIGLSLSQIGWILTVQAASNALVRIFMPQLVRNFGRITILWIFMAIGALAYGIIPFQQQFMYLLITAFILGTGLGVTQPLTIVLSYNASPPGQSGEVLGLRLASNRLAQTIVPFLFAYISSFIGLGTIFFIKSVLLFTGSLTARRILEPGNRQNEKHVKNG